MKKSKALSLLLCGAMTASLFAGMSVAADDVVTLRYALWDANQEPTVREIADAFEL